MLLSPSEGPGVDRELFRHPTPVNTKQNTRAPLRGPGLGTDGRAAPASFPASSPGPPACSATRAPRVGPLGRVLSSLSPLPVPRLALPVPCTHDRCPARGSAAASANPSTARHCPALGAQVGSAPRRVSRGPSAPSHRLVPPRLCCSNAASSTFLEPTSGARKNLGLIPQSEGLPAPSSSRGNLLTFKPGRVTSGMLATARETHGSVSGA